MSDERKTVRIRIGVNVGWQATREKTIEVNADDWRVMNSKAKNESLEKEIASLARWGWDEVTDDVAEGGPFDVGDDDE
jgi:hypothetical protein